MSRIPSFQEFWPFYLSQHLHPASRMLHFFGTTAAFAMLVLAVLGDARLAPLALLAGYGPAWIGHFVFEKNRPATFRYPLWSLRGDFKMWWLMATGRLGAELTRLKLRSIERRSA